MRFTWRETRDLWSAGILISLAFAILLSGGIQRFGFDSRFFIVFLAAFITAGAGFLLHELMHKYVAQHYGLTAEFHAFYPMLGLAIVFSFFGFIFAAPGAVYISGFVTRERNGKIALAGPATNIVLSVLFLLISLILQPAGFLALIFAYGLSINALLAAFNMIPVMPFDGSKIIIWNKGIYVLTAVIAIGLWISSLFVA